MAVTMQTPHGMMEITLVQEQDREAMVRILGSLSPTPDIPVGAISRVEDCLRQQVCFVGKIAGEMVATATFIFFYRLARGGQNLATLEDVVVHPAWQSKGMGKLFLQHILDYLAKQGLHRIVLRCRPEVAGFYAQLGFHEDGVSMRWERPNNAQEANEVSEGQRAGGQGRATGPEATLESQF